jgi:hypothetical protein
MQDAEYADAELKHLQHQEAGQQEQEFARQCPAQQFHARRRLAKKNYL